MSDNMRTRHNRKPCLEGASNLNVLVIMMVVMMTKTMIMNLPAAFRDTQIAAAFSPSDARAHAPQRGGRRQQPKHASCSGRGWSVGL